MIVKRNRVNSNFQIAYFIAGSCFTADAAYVALLNQRDDRRRALECAQVQELMNQANRMQIERDLQNPDEIEQVRAQARLKEFEYNIKDNDMLTQATRDELEFIDQCIARVQPLRKYAHLSDADAAEACQRQEFEQEFRFRIENYIATSGSIPHDQLAAMRQHPDFSSSLLPHIEQTTQLLQAGGTPPAMLTDCRGFDLPRLLGIDHAT